MASLTEFITFSEVVEKLILMYGADKLIPVKTELNLGQDGKFTSSGWRIYLEGAPHYIEVHDRRAYRPSGECVTLIRSLGSGVVSNQALHRIRSWSDMEMYMRHEWSLWDRC
jgi:hypothetical protein